MQTIQQNSVVSLAYSLTNDEGEELDASEPGHPLLYLHGVGQIVPGLESALEGKQLGDKLKVVVPPSEGYGEFDPGLQLKMPLAQFPEDAELYVGMQFVAQSNDGDFQMFWVVGLDEKTVEVDGNHPLAGETLHFDVEVLAIREATAEELDHGHVHGEGGHHH